MYSYINDDPHFPTASFYIEIEEKINKIIYINFIHVLNKK